MATPEAGQVPEWRVSGDWFDVCRCNIPCPCEFAQPPSDGYCQGVLAWRIREGHYGDVRLDGLRLVAIGMFEGNLWTGEAKGLKLGFFVDERADDRQRQALLAIVGGQAGGMPAQLGAIWGQQGQPEVLGVEAVAIEFEVAEDLSRWRAEIRGKVEASAEALSGPTTPAGQRVQTLNPPGSEVGAGGAATWGRATADRVEAFGVKFDWTGRSSKHIPFTWSGPG
jgi:hypothetical protein